MKNIKIAIYCENEDKEEVHAIALSIAAHLSIKWDLQDLNRKTSIFEDGFNRFDIEVRVKT
jgi:hypothetical protein